MDNVTLKIYKWNDVNKTINIQDICSSIKMYCSHTNITTELNFTIAYEYNDYYFYKFDIGDQVCLWYKGGLIFYGRITDSEFNLKNNTYTFTCYDLAWWIIKSNITRNLDNISVKDALRTVFGDIDLKAFDIDSELGDDGNILIGTHLIKNKSAKDVLMAIMQEVSKKTDVYYYMHMNTNCKIIITECDKYYSGVTIQESSKDVIDGNLIDYTINRSMQDMVNKINIFDSDYKQINYLTLSDFDEDRYGTIQDNVILEEDEEYSVEVETKIKKKLDQKGNPSEEVQVKCLGDINYKVGYGVMCKLPDSTFYDRFMYILASEWEWVASGDFISTLSLSTSKHKDLTDFSDIEDKQDDEDGENTGSLADRVVEYAKTFLGYPYLYGGAGRILTEELVKANPKITTLEGANDNWKNWIGKEAYDCSGFTQAVYKHFSIDITRTTTNNQMGQGKAISASDSSKWKEGDLMFPHANHVQMYIGNGKIIHAPESGRVIQIADAKTSYACVRRVLKDEDFIATKSASSNQDASINTAVNCTSQKEFAAAVAPYAKTLFNKYHIFPGVIISCMIQESWTGSGFTKLATKYYNFGGVKCSASSENAIQDYKPPSSEGNMLYRKFDSLKDFIIYWCELISGSSYNYKSAIADKNTPKEQIFGFDNTPYAGDKTKGSQMWNIYSSDGFSKYDEGL
ncbi:XkdQ/YqbQ family protein [Clostridium beijerinckii]|uniref:XkdQ/YqbQ family protein n=1 Tax=Clostridium beijerinckii TaxID=1520 RepID=UPI00098CBA9D|nr:NlpC/P60 family protein [Clostridium beijerinckii]MBA8935521.1 cell wall-associated NlpC family hydrolase [Clostridium beijerinckii]NRU39916.1 cell wall-associated NlpC family hydrolase [Clostridium beijerinckii]NSA96805.1 cell wall-associated NlpC family hydrolase [Clostridium beijerinckii]OOM52294.1 gamma-D-glutamyl-L-lysine endopeptidase [Clostridium beijerinckii]OOM65496.1 gamma-D-glutamyl-L-lysine endopeptidase [Clostridium beijerinckii]